MTIKNLMEIRDMLVCTVFEYQTKVEEIESDIQVLLDSGEDEFSEGGDIRSLQTIKASHIDHIAKANRLIKLIENTEIM